MLVFRFGVYELPTAVAVVPDDVVAVVVVDVVVPVEKLTLPFTVDVSRTEFKVNSNALGSGI